MCVCLGWERVEGRGEGGLKQTQVGKTVDASAKIIVLLAACIHGPAVTQLLLSGQLTNLLRKCFAAGGKTTLGTNRGTFSPSVGFHSGENKKATSNHIEDVVGLLDPQLCH